MTPRGSPTRSAADATVTGDDRTTTTRMTIPADDLRLFEVEA